MDKPITTTKKYKTEKKKRKIRPIKPDMNNLKEMNKNISQKNSSVRFPIKHIDNDIPLGVVEKDIRSNVGKPKNIKKQNKDTLLIEVQSEKQAK